MDALRELDTVRLGFCVLVVFSVITHVFQEIMGPLRFAMRTMGRTGHIMTYVRRREYYVFAALLIVTILAAAIFAVSGAQNHLMLVPLTALMFGFLINMISSGICFINDSGLGSVSPQSVMEIPWREIADYSWDNNVLRIRHKGRRRTAIRFTDSSAILFVNEHLHRITRADLPVVQPES